MKLLIVVGFILISALCRGQNYANRIIPTEFGNVNSSTIIKFEDKYIVDGIFGNNQSSLFALDEKLNYVNHYIYDSTVFSKSSLSLLDNHIYAYSKNRFLSKGLELIQIGSNFKIQNTINLETLGDYNFPISSCQLDQNIYSLFIYEEDNVRKIGGSKIDSSGNIIWINYFNEPFVDYSCFWDLKSTTKGSLLASYVVSYISNFSAVAKILKFDQSGNILFISDPLNGIFNGTAPIWTTELSDSCIFLTFQKDMHLDPDYAWNWHPYPPTFVWLDKNGKIIREDIKKIARDHELDIYDVKKGNGDYFFAYGQIRTDNDGDMYGLITKYTNHGDTIWSHRYRHPDYNKRDHFNYIKDIIEEDNGDLTVLGDITPVGGKTEVWVFRVNSEGCFDSEKCNEFTLETEDTITIVTDSIISVTPNPTFGEITIKGLPDEGGEMTVYDLNGRIVYSYKHIENGLHTLRPLLPGVYIVKLKTSKSKYNVKLVVL